MAAAAKVLIAEDDLVAARLLDTIVRKGGYETAVARSGAEALCRDDLHSFDAVVTDWMMPEVDGIQLIRELRRRVDPAPLVVMVTAIALPEARDYALKAGADEFVQKPFEPKEIVSALHSGLARRAQPDPKPLARRSPRLQTLPPFVGLAIAASTGGPMALTHLFAELPAVRVGACVCLCGPPRP